MHSCSVNPSRCVPGLEILGNQREEKKEKKEREKLSLRNLRSHHNRHHRRRHRHRRLHLRLRPCLLPHRSSRRRPRILHLRLCRRIHTRPAHHSLRSPCPRCTCRGRIPHHHRRWCSLRPGIRRNTWAGKSTLGIRTARRGGTLFWISSRVSARSKREMRRDSRYFVGQNVEQKENTYPQ